MKRRKFSKNFRILILIFSILLIAGFYASSFGFNIPLFQSPRIVENFEISFHNPSDNYNAGMDAFDKVINSLVLKSNVELDNEDIESIDVLIDGNMFKSYEKGISVLDSYVGYLIVIPLSPDYLPEGNHVMELVVNLKNGKRSSITHSYFSDVTRPDVKISPDGLTLNVWDENGIKEVKSKYYGDNGFEEISGLNFEGKEIIDGKEYSKYKFENFNVHLGRIIHFVLDENDNERLISSSGAKGSVAVSDYLRNNGFINEEINEEIKKILEQGNNNNNNNNNNNQRSGSSCNIPAKFILPLYYDSTIPGDKDRVQSLSTDIIVKTHESFHSAMILMDYYFNSHDYEGFSYDHPVTQLLLWDINDFNNEFLDIFKPVIDDSDLLVGIEYNQTLMDLMELTNYYNYNPPYYPIWNFYGIVGGDGITRGATAVNGGYMYLGLYGRYGEPGYEMLDVAKTIFHEFGHALGLDHYPSLYNIMYTSTIVVPEMGRLEENQAFAMKAHLCGTSDGEPISFLEQSGKWGVNVNYISEEGICGNGGIGFNQWCEKGLYKEGPKLPASEACVDPSVNPPHWSFSAPAGKCNIVCGCTYPVPQTACNDPYSTDCDDDDDDDPPGSITGDGEPASPTIPGGGPFLDIEDPEDKECTAWYCFRMWCLGEGSTDEEGTCHPLNYNVPFNESCGGNNLPADTSNTKAECEVNCGDHDHGSGDACVPNVDY